MIRRENQAEILIKSRELRGGRGSIINPNSNDLKHIYCKKKCILLLKTNN